MVSEENNTEGQAPQKGVTRRYFVKGAGLIAGGAVALGGVTFLESCASTTTPATTSPTTTTTTPPPTTQQSIPAATNVYQFFNAVEAATIQAAFGQLIPGTAADPGAVQAQADVYIDHALMGAYANLQQTYKRGIVAMNAYSQAQFSNTFASLTSTQQISVLTDMQNGAAATATYFYFPTATQFFSLLLTHVNE